LTQKHDFSRKFCHLFKTKKKYVLNKKKRFFCFFFQKKRFFSNPSGKQQCTVKDNLLYNTTKEAYNIGSQFVTQP